VGHQAPPIESGTQNRPVKKRGSELLRLFAASQSERGLFA